MASRPFSGAVALLLTLLPLAADSGVIGTADTSGESSVRIVSPSDNATLPHGQPINIEYEASLGFKARHIQLQLGERESVVLDEPEGSHSFRDVEPGEYAVRAALLNRAYAELGIDHTITITVEKP
ncbi:hypothetical protein [Thiohalomonas denitrificans]|uniref:hypothetical protein n=1 Tax=Thiohalomonas denitrificans TaxID=415747 RepID=UPI0026F2B29A|nr:hypothetical protein [Thiohalomonas denitrificans]